MDRVFDWILANPEEAGLLATLLITAVVTIYRMGWAGVRESLRQLMHLAERLRRQGRLPIDGPQVLDWVVARAMVYVVPAASAWLRPFLTEARVRAMVQRLFDSMLDWIDDGQLNGSQTTTQEPAQETAAMPSTTTVTSSTAQIYDPARNQAESQVAASLDPATNLKPPTGGPPGTRSIR